MNADDRTNICGCMADPARAPLLQHAMRVRLLVVVASLAAGCGGSSKKPTPEPGPGSGPPPDPGVVAQTLVGWGSVPAPGGKLSVFVEVADHTGASKSYPLGTTMGSCGVVPASGPDVVTALRCATDGVGHEYRAVYRTAIIVLRRPVDPTDDPADVDLMFQEVLRVEVPAGSKVGAAL